MKTNSFKEKLSQVAGYDLTGNKVKSIHVTGVKTVMDKLSLIYDIQHLDFDYFYSALELYSYAELKEILISILKDKQFINCEVIYPEQNIFDTCYNNKQTKTLNYER